MYSPKIDEGLIPVLYRLAKERKIPMTRLVITSRVMGIFLSFASR